MRKLVLFVSMFFIALGVSAQSMYGDAAKADVKVKYVYSFQEALKKAKEEKKPIFFNCFADWAIPCHSMNKVVFSDHKFADWLNKHFVNFFIDVTTKEGLPFAKRYNIQAQAHYLVLDGNGDILLRVVGGRKLHEFQEILSYALNPKTTLPEMNKKYEAGERNVKFLRDYAILLKAAGEADKASKVTDEFFLKLKKSERCKKENWNLYVQKAFRLDDELFQFMVEHKKDFVKYNGLDEVNQAIAGAYFREIYTYTYENKVYDSGKLLDLYLNLQKSGVPDTSLVYTVFDIVKYKSEKNIEKLLDILENKTKGWDVRLITGIDFALLDLKDLSTSDENRVTTYIKKKMDGMDGKLLGVYQKEIDKVENTGGMKFVDLSFEEVLQKAKKEGKLVFLDCYTSWCVPCKKMSNQVFTLKHVGDFMNEHFINVKIDMENGEGVALAKRYDVKAFPTMFLLNAEGEPIYKILGAHDARTFMNKVERGLKLSYGYSIAKRKYAEGDRSVALMADYFLAMQDAGEIRNPEGEVNAYLSSLKAEDKYSKPAWVLYDNFVNSYSNPEFRYLVENREKFAKNVGDSAVNKKVEKVIFPMVLEYQEGVISSEFMSQVWDLVNSANFSPDYSLVLLNKIMTMYDKKEYGKMLDFYEKTVAVNRDAKVRLNLDVILYRLLKSASPDEKSRAQAYARKQMVNASEGAKRRYAELIEALGK